MPNSYVSVYRDPFARFDVVRKIVDEGQSCAWCSGKRKNGTLFLYGVQMDSIRNGVSWDRRGFCSFACRKAYHDYE
jgi:hypothetical protein